MFRPRVFPWWRPIALLVFVCVPALALGQAGELAVAHLLKGQQYEKEGKYQDAVAEYEKGLPYIIQLYGREHVSSALFQAIMGRAYKLAGKPSRGEELFLESIPVLEAKLGKNHSKVGEIINNLGELYRETRQFAKAEPRLKRALQILEAEHGADHLDVAIVVDNLGLLYLDWTKFAQAEPLLLRSLKVREAKLGPEAEEVARSLNNLGGLYQETQQLAKAEAALVRALKIKEKKLGPAHPEVALSQFNLAGLYVQLGKLGQAEQLYEKSLAVWEQAPGKGPPMLARALAGLATMYVDLGQFARAEQCLLRALRVQEATLEADHPEIAQSLVGLAHLYQQQAQYAKAEPLYLRALKIREARLGKNHADLGLILNNLAELYDEVGAADKAEPYHYRCLEIAESQFGKQHPLTALSLNNLGGFLALQRGKIAEGETLIARALEIQQAHFGKDHPELGFPLFNLALLKCVQNQHLEGGAFMDRSRKLDQAKIHGTLLQLSEKDQLTFLKTQTETNLQAALLLGFKLRDQHEPLLALSAGWILNGRALTLEVLAERARFLNAAPDSEAGAWVGELQAVQKQLTELTLAPPKNIQEDVFRRQIQSLQKQEETLFRKLAQQDSGLRPAAWVDVQEVRKNLAAGQVLVEIGRFPKEVGLGGKKYPDHYVAWVIPPEGKKLAIVELGEAARMDAAIRAVVEHIKATPGAKGLLSAKGEPESEAMLKQALKPLSEMILAPLLPYLKEYKHWLLSPESSLWLVPWEMLLLADDRYAIEDYALHYVNSGRYLARGGKTKPGHAGRPYVFADPDFDLTPGRPQQVDKEPQLRQVNSGLEGFLGKVPRLPGTAAEAEAIQLALARYTGYPVKVLKDQQALKSLFLGLHSPRVLVLSTHGFFLAQQGNAADNPLLRCGLLLAGANHFKSAAAAEDGVVTGMDVLRTDLGGTELVVLSACETGLGDVRQGEGIAGLRQAFQLAGAKAVVSSLWNVPDRETALLMTEFFANLESGQDKAEALRRAKLKLIHKRRTDFAAAHPFFWAAFTLTGQSAALSAVKLPMWHADYFAAQELAQKERKPLAVFVGAGELGFHQVSKEEALGGEIMDVLTDRFVCVFLDRRREDHRKLIDFFEVKTGPGLVLSDRGGARQIFAHAGTLENAALLRMLRKALP